MTRAGNDVPCDRDVLERLLGPADASEFIARTSAGDVLFLEPGPHARLTVDRAGLDRALESIRVTPGRVRVVKDGEPVPDSSLLEPVSPGDAAAGESPFLRLSGPGLAAVLADGGTLIVNSVDELLPEVDVALRSLERALGSYQGFANLYATWGVARGFDVHVDDHDTCIVQVAGAKEWYLLSRDAEVAALQGQPLDAIRSSGHLEHVVAVRAGCLLYVPRGVPHFAQPLEEHSLHITLGYRRPTIADFVRWLLTQPEALALSTSLLLEGDQLDVMSSLLELPSAESSDLVRRFFAAIADSSRARPSIRVFAP